MKNSTTEQQNTLQVFTSEEFGSIRTLNIDNVPYFVGKDIAQRLGYSNTRKAILDHVDSEDKKDCVTIRDAIGREVKLTGKFKGGEAPNALSLRLAYGNPPPSSEGGKEG